MAEKWTRISKSGISAYKDLDVVVLYCPACERYCYCLTKPEYADRKNAQPYVMNYCPNCGADMREETGDADNN